MKFRPIEDYIVIKITFKSSSIILPNDTQRDVDEFRPILTREVYAIGPEVKYYKVGDIVLPIPKIPYLANRRLSLSDSGIEEENKDVAYIFCYEKEVVGVVEEEDVTESPTKE